MTPPSVPMVAVRQWSIDDFNAMSSHIVLSVIRFIAAYASVGLRMRRQLRTARTHRGHHGRLNKPITAAFVPSDEPC
jgi:hypothetical protein